MNDAWCGSHQGWLFPAASILGTGPGFTIADPVKAHADRFQPFLLDGVVGKAVGGEVVDLVWSGRLRVT